MKRLLRSLTVLTVAASILSASQALAQGGIDFSWNSCGAAGAANKTFACNSNAGTVGLAIGSFMPPAGINILTGVEIVVDLVTNNSTLDPWWQFKNPGSCRLTSLGMNFTYSGSDCADYFGLAGGASGNVASYTLGGHGPNSARILGVAAVDQTLAAAVDPSTEYFAFNLTLNGAKTVGLGSCAGCDDPVCLVLNSIKLTQPAGVGDHSISDPGSRANFITWQGTTTNCPQAVPTRNTTWGQVKALYR